MQRADLQNEHFVTAAGKGDLRTVARMLDHGLSPDCANAKGDTALMYAAYYGKLSVVDLLIHRKASLDKENPYGRTALMDAAVKGYPEIVRKLIEAGAHASHASTVDGLTALMAAATGRTKAYEEVVKLDWRRGGR